ncbi:receptor-interacting serine/threonine-protein kinase 1 isoform X2 [Hyperolius riggenbachi]
MHRLNHQRVVKLLGILLEDGNYSLVMEYMTKGNLLNVLTQTNVPLSVKARFILEIIEGMAYLHSQKVIHKDLKPTNILADDEFHVKIADLGVAAFQKWSTLTKEETSRKRSRSRKSDTAKPVSACTLSYLAPEHLREINTRATVKSDVYSFGIVIWVILSDKEPYENVLTDSQLSLGVRDGQRPDMTDDLQNSFKEASDLMQQCWKDEPGERPSFEECEKIMKPVYTEKYEGSIEQDLSELIENYPKDAFVPDALVQRMASLQVDCDAEPPSMPTRDNPQSLHSSMGLAQGNVDENLFRASNNEPVESEEEKPNEILQRKLEEEIHYHWTGSHTGNITDNSRQAGNASRSRKVFNEPSISEYSPGNFPPYGTEQPAQTLTSYPYHNAALPPDLYSQPTNDEYYVPHDFSPMANPQYTPAPHVSLAGILGSTPHPTNTRAAWMGPTSSASHGSTTFPIPESGMQNPYLPNPNYAYPSDISHMGGTPGSHFSKRDFSYAPAHTPEKLMNVTISNSKAVQIGHGNYMSVVGESFMTNRHVAVSPNLQYQPAFDDDTAMNESQFQLLRDNLSRKWKEFARLVGFRPAEIEEVDHDYERDGLREKVYQMVYKWQMKEGTHNVTVGKTAKALSNLGETELLTELIQRTRTI